MPVLGLLSVALEVPSLGEGIQFYTDAGLDGISEGRTVRLRCAGQDRDSITLIGGGDRKRLHHIALRAEQLDDIAVRVSGAGGHVVGAPGGFEASGLWVRDPNGMLLHLVERRADPELAEALPYEVNGPGRIVRKHRAAMRPSMSYGPVKPLRLGHVVAFSPDVPRSLAFATEALGMGLADRVQDVVAFCCARNNSDHHVLAFAMSPGIGMHHVSFQVNDPDEVGRGGRALVEKVRKGDWGFGRHTIGSNFFHYVQDPWGSWLEYYSDMDFIDDYALWTPTNYCMEDGMANWGPSLPKDFLQNCEVEGNQG